MNRKTDVAAIKSAYQAMAAAPDVAERARVVTLDDLKIRTKDKRLVTLIPNPVQEKYLDSVCPGWRDRERKGTESDSLPSSLFPLPSIRGVRDRILKARQEGLSTIILALIFLDTINHPYTYSMVIAHDSQTTEKLFKIVHRFYQNLPPDKKRPCRVLSRTEIEFSDLDSGIYVGTAGGKAVGRGGTIQNLHKSERAFWDCDETVDTGLMESLAPDGNAWEETTANGLNDFHRNYEESVKGENNWRAHFFAWFEHPDYRISDQIQNPKSKIQNRTAEEEALAEKHSLSDEQLAWRRWKKADLKDLFEQEYPATWIEAFRARSKHNFFPIDYLYALLDALDARGFAPGWSVQPGEHEWSGFCEVYQEADRMECDVCEGLGRIVAATGRPAQCYACKGVGSISARYVIGVDVAEGLQTAGRDWTTADVFCVETWTQVASYWAQADTRLCAIDIATLASLYGGAKVCVERNNMGVALINELEAQGVDLYRHEPEDGDPAAPPERTRYGYITTAKSKGYVDAELRAALEDAARGGDSIRLRCRRAILELIHYVNLPGGKRGAEIGHDDHVRSVGLAHVLLMEEGLPGQYRPPFVPNAPRVLYGTSRR